MTAAEIARKAAEQRAAMLARLQPVKQEARSRLGELRAQAESLKGNAQDAATTRQLTAGHANDLFITPRELAARMVEIADIRPGMAVLEPSAGTGRIVDAVKNAGGIVECVEWSYELADHLRRKGHTVTQGDFMTWIAPREYDAVIMNPPFSNGQDADHVQRAYECTKAGGLIVAIMGEGVFFRSDKKSVSFRAWLETVGGTSEQLPANTFGQSGTGVNTRLVIINKE